MRPYASAAYMTPNSLRLFGLNGALALHLFVGETKEFFCSFGRIFAARITDAALNGNGKVPAHGHLSQLFLHAVNDDLRIFGGSLNEKHAELIGAMACHQ